MHSTMIILGSLTLNQVLSYVAAVIVPILAFLWAVFKDSYTIKPQNASQTPSTLKILTDNTN